MYAVETISPNVVPQLTPSIMSDRYNLRTHVYTDGPVSSSTASVCVVVPSHNVTSKLKLNHVTPGTASKLAADTEAVRFIQVESPLQWAILSDSKSALEII